MNPGFIFVGKFGIRIENLCIVEQSTNSDDYLHFKDLTLVPYERNLIDVSLLTNQEIDQINQYHQRILNTLSPDLNKNMFCYLKEKTKLIKK